MLLVSADGDAPEQTLAALRAEGLEFELGVARTPAETLDRLLAAREPPLFLLLDLAAGPCLDLLRALRADARLRSVPAVWLAGPADLPDLPEAYRLGANSCVQRSAGAELDKRLRASLTYWLTLNQTPGRGT